MPKRPPAGSKSSRVARNQGARIRRPGSKKRVFSLRWIISGAAIALTSITVLAVGGLAERNAREALDRELRTRLMLEARNVALTSSGALLSEFPELTLTPILSALREEQPELAFAVVVDHEGEVRGHPDARKIGTKFELPHGLVSAGRATELGEEEQIAVNADVMLAAVPVKRAGGHRIGTALVAVHRAYVDELISEARRKQAILVAVLLVAGIVSAATLVSFLLRPVSVLREGLERIGRGDLETPVRLKDRTELGLLAETMNEMSQRLRDAQEEKLEKERLSREVELAREIQSSLLPTGGLEVNGFVIDGSQQSALEVGGDYYDIFPLEDGRVGIAVADVSGKGLAGCLVTSMLSALLRAFRNTETSPSALLVRLEENLKDSLRPGTFITMFYGTLDPERGSLSFASAGHSPLLVHRGETGETEWYKTTGIPIGAIRNGALRRSLSDHTVWLGPRDLIVQYTDGINEAFDVTGEHQFGFERLEKAAAAAAAHGCRAVLDGVREAVRTWAGDHPPDDDETLLVVGRQPVAAKATPRAAGPEKFTQVRFSSSVMAHNPVTLLHLAKTRGRHLPLTADLDGLAVLPGWLATCPGFETLDSREAVVVETGVYEAAANIIDPIPPALKDRMEVIRISGYTDIDKLAIAKQFLFPRQREENGISEKQVKTTDKAILAIIHEYTREAGLRNLEREISTICRKVARRIAEGEKGPFTVTPRNLSKFLGVPKYLPETEGERDEVGVATGLAWTPTGGDILFIEVSLVRGKGSVTITGSLGEVMKESAQAAITYTRSRAARLGLPKDFHARYDIHIHVPAGAIPKDGPSAGITIATALISSLTGIPVRRDVAMTGEITLRGRVLPIGGLKEKALAALRAGITEVIVPGQNRKDLEEIPRGEARRFRFILVDSMDEVVSHALKKNPFRAMAAGGKAGAAEGRGAAASGVRKRR